MVPGRIFSICSALPGSRKWDGIHAISYGSIASFVAENDYSEAPDARYWPACQAPGTPWEASDPSLFVPGRAEPISHTPAAAADRLAELPYEIASPRHDISLRSSISLVVLYSTKFGTDVCNGVAEAAATAQGVDADTVTELPPQLARRPQRRMFYCPSPLTPQASHLVRYGLTSDVVGYRHVWCRMNGQKTVYSMKRRAKKVSVEFSSPSRSLRLSSGEYWDPPPAASANRNKGCG
ncbi:hypothetical protein ASPBRDRAFT_54420 [Aspergillus brasiliensis CBS 101740]|uniref:Uncharacterized protein n=1 Tax=Aspergillus brasiliensis (strain CBS 101740 / IMI 381727 / IBT 21946) TaxID=767769 RepID=A0A1L9ULP5_ASPBC|nr:hypothetical protein ASPBRDRAFT_54420 [Aspergillus brasiliensis CBS 101740]